MNYADFMSYHRSRLEQHSELKYQPTNRQEQVELGEVCMAMIKKSLSGGTFSKLPYDKTTKVSEKPEYNEHELLQQLPPAGMFEDLHDKSICP